MPTIWTETAKDVFLKAPFNLVGTVLTLGLVKRLLTSVGPQAYVTSFGNLKIAGITLLGCAMAGVFVLLGQRLFGIEEGEDTNKAFSLLLLAMLLNFVCFFVFLGRACLILIHVIHPGNPPPYIDWMFRSILHFL